jgi:transposase InsO family protein
MKSRLVVQALENAALMRGDVAGCVVHSDRISIPRRCSAPSADTAWSGAWEESGRAATTPPWNRSSRCCRRTSSTAAWTTREQLRIAMVTWIERTYHRRRRQARLGRLTPIEFETIMNTTVALAA